MNLFMWKMKPHIFHNGSKAPQTTLWNTIHFHYENNEKNESMFDLKVNYKCIESTWKLKDEEAQLHV